MSTTSINLPQLLLVLLISGLAIRYFFFSPSTSPSSSSSSSTSSDSPAARSGPASSSHRSAGARVNPQHVEQLSAMFPQAGRRDIMWDLQRNGGSVAATSERILAGAGLDVPPPSFQPPLPTSSTPSTTTSSANPEVQVDLIQRYHLSGKLGAKDMEEGEGEKGKGKEAWSSSKSERQALLQRRREEMILGARRRLEMQGREKTGMGAGKVVGVCIKRG